MGNCLGKLYPGAATTEDHQANRKVASTLHRSVSTARLPTTQKAERRTPRVPSLELDTIAEHDTWLSSTVTLQEVLRDQRDGPVPHSLSSSRAAEVRASRLFNANNFEFDPSELQSSERNYRQS